jgi:hypothetical protein
MFFQKINRTDPEKVFIVVKNSWSTAALAEGYVVCWDYTTDADGVGVTQPTTALLKLAAGVAADAIAVGEYGLIQVYGHCTTATVDGTTGVNVGVALQAVNGAWNLAKGNVGVTAAGASYNFIAGETYTTGAAAAKKVFLRCL